MQPNNLNLKHEYRNICPLVFGTLLQSLEQPSVPTKFSISYHQAGPSTNITDGIVMWAAAIVVITAGGSLKRAASPCKARVTILKDTAASVALRARVIIVTHSRRLCWRWRRRSGVGRILAFLYGIWGLHGNSTLARESASHITLHPNIASLSPATAPWILHNPVISSIFCAISNSSNTMVQRCPTSSRKYTLKICKDRKIYLRLP